MNIALEIVKKAKELGFDKYGIIPIEDMTGYEEKLDERMNYFP